MRIAVPELSLIVLIGPSGRGKSTFAARHFLPTEVLSFDRCRARGRLTVVDATNTQPTSRAPLVELAKNAYVQAVAVPVRVILNDRAALLGAARHAAALLACSRAEREPRQLESAFSTAAEAPPLGAGASPTEVGATSTVKGISPVPTSV